MTNSITDLRDSIHADVQNLHLDMIKQFQLQEKLMLSQMISLENRLASLVEENLALKEDNERLRNAFR